MYGTYDVENSLEKPKTFNAFYNVEKDQNVSNVELFESEEVFAKQAAVVPKRSVKVLAPKVDLEV